MSDQIKNEVSNPVGEFQIRYGFRGGTPVTLERLQEEVGAGWKVIIAALVEDLKNLGWNGQVIQVKEKFGGLRFYVESETDEIHSRIKQAEAEAYRICEYCGAPGEMRGGGWLKTLCEACHVNREQERAARG